MSEQPADQTQPIEPDGSDQSGGGGSRTPIIIGVSLLVAGVLGVGAFAAVKLLGGGPQPAEALPDNVIAYVAVDIDPGASQKIEALKALRKFPDLRKELDDIGEKDDIRKKIFEEAVAGTDCADAVDFDDDVEPWLGKSAALGAVDLDGDEPSPVFALAVSDEGAAKKGVKALVECGGEDDDFSYGFNDGFLIISDGDDHADQIIKDAAKGTLADDEGFQEWSDKAGGDGIISFYVGEEAAGLIADLMADEVPEGAGDVEAALKQFKGMAGAVRFADAGLELEIASEGGQEFVGDDNLGDALTALPKDAAIALGLGVPDDFAETLLDQLTSTFGGQADSMIAQAEAETGLDLPDDLETLLGDAVLLALDGDAPNSLADTQGPADIPAGLKILGDADDIEAVIGKAEERAGMSLADAGIVTDKDDDAFVLATGDDFAKSLLAKGSLGDSDNFKSVVPNAGDAAFAFFINFDSDWIKTIVNTARDFGAPTATVTQIEDNTAPLGALGISGWRDGDVSHALIKLTTD